MSLLTSPTVVAALGLVLLLTSCETSSSSHDRRSGDRPPAEEPAATPEEGWVYQLQDYPGGRLDALARASQPLAVIDLARDAATDYFSPAEVSSLRASGKKVLAYFEIGSIETFRPEYRTLLEQAPDLNLNRWREWPDELFVKYWSPRWWDLVVRPRLDRALRAGYDGVYLDTPLAYEAIPLDLAGGRSRVEMGRAMVDLLIRISRYARGRRPGFLIVPQNSPELRHHSGYLEAIDGIGVEELFYVATDEPCTADWCAENLRNTRRIRDAGKFVLAVDYASRESAIRDACVRYAQEDFRGYVADVTLDRINTECER